jgi:hypothetical protein
MVVEKFYSLVKPEVIENYRTVSRITSLLQFQNSFYQSHKVRQRLTFKSDLFNARRHQAVNHRLADWIRHSVRNIYVFCVDNFGNAYR